MIIDNTNILKFFKKDSKIKSLSKYHLAVCVAHIGVSVFAIGAVSENYFNEEVIESVKPGEKISIGKNYLIFDKTRDDLRKIIDDENNDKEMIDLAQKDLNEINSLMSREEYEKFAKESTN